MLTMKILMMYKRTMNSQFLAIDIMMNIQTLTSTSTLIQFFE